MSPVALVTGAAGGIGRETVKAFLDNGYDVVAVDAVDAVHQLPEELGVDRARVTTTVTDITDEQSVSALASEVGSVHGQLNTIALVAGVVQSAAAVTELDPAEFRKVMDVNLTGPFLLTRSLTPLLSRGDGSITFISSWWGRSGHAYFSSYCASKAAVIVFAQALAEELAPDIRVNTVCPGNIDTKMHRAALHTEAAERGITFEEMKDIEWAKIPLKIAGPPSAIADALVWLASPAASYVTGASLDVNGGVVFH
ncbi:SDR family oxidoreductase [Mycobacterium hodleri]|uniref:SDR family oxidoreductase n=1 Tax=Mycolicibacterium hodleri TaxID=49897 RepID=A0A544W7M1_9MYCO|nr:SDR family NAD(P)-dependent oxidoreductase [Mycolicibacterium hodleri]TQR88231.1 SDR family oxidoreductase [Mycolicibacterium hodleri]